MSSSVSGIMYLWPFNDSLVSYIYKTLFSLGRHHCNPVRYGKTTFLHRNCTVCSCNFGKSRDCYTLHGKSFLKLMNEGSLEIVPKRKSQLYQLLAENYNFFSGIMNPWYFNIPQNS